MKKSALSVSLFLFLLVLCCTPLVSPAVALGLGILLALTVGTPFQTQTRRWTRLLLQASIVGLGFGMSLDSVLEAGSRSVGLTIATLVGTLGLGILFGRALGVEKTIAWLISCGTAICGGSAIAAVGPVLRADARQMSVALGTVFVLNAVGLFIFPPIGNALDLSQVQFGMWAAIAVHDTSSVVGAAAKFGSEALQVATTVKLTRALWIIPLVLVASRIRHEENVRVAIPWFIFLFIVAVLLRTLLGDVDGLFPGIASVAKQAMVVTLFLIGAGLSREVLKGVGVRPFLLGIVLWIAITLSTLGLVLAILT